jgi:hypothetical protein
MTYRGIVSNGVVVIEGEKPLNGTIVEVTPVAPPPRSTGTLAGHPALGMWKDRTDLPEDSVAASKILRQELMRRADE